MTYSLLVPSSSRFQFLWLKRMPIAVAFMCIGSMAPAGTGVLVSDNSALKALCAIVLALDPSTDDAKLLHGLADVTDLPPFEWLRDEVQKKAIPFSVVAEVKPSMFFDRSFSNHFICLEIKGPQGRVVPILIIEVTDNGNFTTIGGAVSTRSQLPAGKLVHLLSNLQLGKALCVSMRGKVGIPRRDERVPADATPPIHAAVDQPNAVNSLREVAAGVWMAKSVSVAKIPPGSVDLKVPVPVKNNSNSEVTFSKFVGACSCFKTAGGDLLLAPQTQGTLLLTFDVSRWAPGEHFETQVMFQIGSTGRAPVRIDISGKISDQDYFFVDPNQIDFGIVKQSDKPLSRELTVYVMKPSSTSAGARLTAALRGNFPGVKIIDLRGASYSGLTTVKRLQQFSLMLVPEEMRLGDAAGEVIVTSSVDPGATLRIPWKVNVVSKGQ